MGRLLCNINQLPEDGDCSELAIDGEYFFAVRQYDELFIYRNSCPHIGTPLNWQKNKFLNLEKCFIQCFSHGALFEINTGLCVAGPCHGQSLETVKYELKEQEVFI